MLLDRVDIDHHGPLNRVELGPFSEYLNVVSGPSGSGKTAIARFIRDSLIRREYPLGMMSSSGGRVVWADRNGKIHCRREQDGTATGRRTIEFECRGDVSHRFDWLHGTWIEGIADSTDATRAHESIRIPESIVEGILTDTAVASVAHVVRACLQSGLTDPSLFAKLPLGESPISSTSPKASTDEEATRRVLRDELARVESELATLAGRPVLHPFAPEHSHAQSRRVYLENRLAELQASWPSKEAYGATAYPWTTSAPPVDGNSDQLTRLHDRIWQLRVRERELHRWLEHLQSDRNRVRYTAPLTASPYADHPMVSAKASTFAPAAYHSSATSIHRIDSTLRTRLQDIDRQLISWRRALTEVQGLREAILSGSPRFASPPKHWGSLPLSDQALRSVRLNHFLNTLDHFPGSVDASAFTSDAERRAMGAHSSQHWPEEIDMRIDAIVRQIEFLVAEYDRPNGFVKSWYRPAPLYRSAENARDASLVQSLAAIRSDLQQVRRYGFQFAMNRSIATEQSLALSHRSNLYDLGHTEQWLIRSINHLLEHRASLVQDRELSALVHYPSWLDDSYHRQEWSAWYVDHLRYETDQRNRELNAVVSELQGCLDQASRLRQQMGNRPTPLSLHTQAENVRTAAIQGEIDAILAELRSLEHPYVDADPASSRWHWLVARREELIQQLGVPYKVAVSQIPLADEASQWLVRLSGGRLRRVDWSHNLPLSKDQARPAVRFDGSVTIDARDESTCSGVDRALAALAVRIAAADLLARTGRAIPVIVETHAEWADSFDTVIAALDDYSKSGRQVILLTSETKFADRVTRRGGRAFEIHAERTAHEHRPLWRPHFGHETYVGPHAGAHLANPPMDTLQYSGPFVEQYFDSTPPMASRTMADANRSLDAIWQEAYNRSPWTTVAATPHYAPYQAHPEYLGSDPYAAQQMPSPPPAQPVSSVGPIASMVNETADPSSPWRDGYYYADRYTTAPTSANGSAAKTGNRKPYGEQAPAGSSHGKKPSPFFLTVDSPIDQAPSVDAVAAARLRGLNVTHINHLMQQDPNRLADAIGLAGVTAATIRRWQSECRLVCHVPQLRGFDARILVGCGISDAGHLAATDPNDLLDRVEAFLATERGQRILLSGTSYELSRITSWIAAANVSTDEVPAVSARDHRTIEGRVITGEDERGVFGRGTYEYEFVNDNGEVIRARTSRPRRFRSDNRSRRQRAKATGRGHVFHGGDSVRNSGSGRRSATASGSVKNARSSKRRSNGAAHRTARDESQVRRDRYERAPVDDQHGSEDRQLEQHVTKEQELRFYLQRESPVVDAPSIGNRMAERLEAVGVYTVDDLLNSDPDDLATQLDHRRVDAEVITSWQNQSILVCRIPMLRGHDAQLLVASEITTPEEVAEYDPAELLALIDPIARSNEGKRILRGGKLPDLDEITDWINYASLNRDLVAA